MIYIFSVSNTNPDTTKKADYRKRKDFFINSLFVKFVLFLSERYRLKPAYLPTKEVGRKVVLRQLFPRPRWSEYIEIKLWKSLLHRALYQAHLELGIYVSRASLLLFGSFLTASKVSVPHHFKCDMYGQDTVPVPLLKSEMLNSPNLLNLSFTFLLNRAVISANWMANICFRIFRLRYAAILLAILWLPLLISAQNISGTGYGETEEIARQNALANLSSQLYVQVESRITDISGEEDLRAFARTVKEITTTSNLPLMGTRFMPTERMRNEYKVSVILEPERALPLYEDKLKELQQKLSETAVLIKSNKGDSHSYEQLMRGRSYLEEFATYRYIYLALHGKTAFSPPFSEAEITAAIAKLTREFEDLKLAIDLASKSFQPHKQIYVYFPSVYPSAEVTPFSRVVHNHLQTGLATVDKPENALYYLRSSYEIHQDLISMSLRLIDKQGNITAATMIRLKPQAYRNYEYAPKTIDLAKLIESGELISNNLHIELAGLEGSNQLFYVRDDIVRLKVKSNLPVEYFIVVHTHSNEGVYSYLLELNPTFINRISADQSNRWIELAEFQVQEPFGVETLQLFASTGSIKPMLPPVKYDNNTGLYKIADKPTEAVATTRGLRPVRREIETAETTLTITTMER